MSFLKKLTKDAKKAVSSMGDNVDRGRINTYKA